MALAEYLVEIDQDLWLTMLLEPADAAAFPNPASPPAAVGTPTLTSLTPNTAEVGAPPVQVALAGTGFSAISRVLWNGNLETGRVVSATRIDITVRPETASGPWTVPVAVVTGSARTAARDFTFTEPDPEE